MSAGGDRVGKTIYRAVLRSARRFDRFPASKALIHRFMIEGTGPQELSAEQRIYAAGLEALVGGRFAGPDRIKWPLQRLVQNLSRGDSVNRTAARVVASSKLGGSGGGGCDNGGASIFTPSTGGRSTTTRVTGIPGHDELDFAVQTALAKFFPPELSAVERKDVCNAGFAALRELSTKWALAKTLGLDAQSPRTWRKRPARRSSLWPMRKRISSRVQRRSGAREARRTQSPRSPTTSSSSPPPSSPSSSTSSSSSTAAWALQAASGWAIEPTRTPAKGVFLISHPLVGLGLDHPSSIFHRSVVLLVDHSDRLSYGLIVNKDRDVTLRDVVSPGALPQASDLMACFTDNPVRTGGPVMPCFSWLHQHESVGGVPLNDGPVGKQVFFCGRADKASELVGAGTTRATDFSLFMGASTWEGGMLNRELARGDWIMAEASAELALSGGKNLWREMLETMGGEYLEMSRLPHAQRWTDLGAQSRPSDLQL